MWEVMQQCWLTDPEKRPAMSDVVEFLVQDNSWRNAMSDQASPDDPLSAVLRRCSIMTLTGQNKTSIWTRLLRVGNFLSSIRWVTVAQAAMVVTGIVLTTLGSVYAQHRATYLAWGIIMLYLAFEIDRDFVADARSLGSGTQYVVHVSVVYMLGSRFRDRTEASLWVV